MARYIWQFGEYNIWEDWQYTPKQSYICKASIYGWFGMITIIVMMGVSCYRGY